MVVRELLAMLGFKVDKKSAAAAERQIDMLKKSATRLAGILITGAAAKAFFNLVQNTAALADETAKTAQKLGITNRALQELRHSAALSNVTNEELSTGLRFLAKNAFEASTGNKELGKDFARVGVSVTDARGKLKPAEQLFTEMADGFSRLGNETERTALAQQLFGRGGLQLLPMLVQGSAAIMRQRMEAHELGAVMDEELIAISEEYMDTQDRLRAVWQGIKNILAKALIPLFDKNAKKVIEWVKANRELLKQRILFWLDKVVRLVGALYWGVTRLAGALDGWVRQLPPLAQGLLAVGVAALALAIILASPVASLALLIVLLALIIEDFKVWSEGGESAVGDLIAAFDDLLAEWGFVGTIIREGAMAWWEYMQIIIAAIGSVQEFLINVWTGNIVEAFTTLKVRLIQIWDDIVTFIENRMAFVREKLLRGLLPDWLVDAMGNVDKASTTLMRGGSDSAVINALTGRGGSTSNIQSQTSITVNAAPGQSEQAVADAVVSKIEQQKEKDLRAAAAAYGVVGPGGGKL